MGGGGIWWLGFVKVGLLLDCCTDLVGKRSYEGAVKQSRLLCRFPRSAGELLQRNYGIILLEYSFIILTAMAANIKVLYR